VSQVENVSGRFAQIAGFRMTWDANGTAQELDADGMVTTIGSRVVHVELDNGTVIVDNGMVQPGPALNVATIDFLARGGDQYPFRGAPFTSVGVR
jgi:5'-nucleotidase